MEIKFNKLVEEELVKALKTHGPETSYHQGYAILLEEVDEFWDIVKQKSSKRNHLDALKELVQISAMAQKLAEDVVIPLLEKK